MLRSVFFSSFIFLLAPLLLAQSLALPVEVDAIGGDILQSGVWDFSQQWIRNDRGRASVAAFGDSLIAETFDGRRFWYAVKGDSVAFCGEEDRLTAISLDTAAFVHPAQLTIGFANSGTSFSAQGKGGGKKFDIAETGVIASASSPRKGRLILAPGDTLTNILAVKETRRVTATFPGDSSAVATEAMTETYRWYDADGLTTLMPLALQRTVYYPYDVTNPVAMTSTAYLPERGDYKIDRADDSNIEGEQTDVDAIAAALQNASIVCDGKTVGVTATLPNAGLNLTIDIVDAAGHLYLHNESKSTGGADEIRIDCTSLNAGEYIAVVGVTDIPTPPKKQLIVIR